MLVWISSEVDVASGQKSPAHTHRSPSIVGGAKSSVGCDQYWYVDKSKDPAFTDQAVNVVGVGDLHGAEGLSVALMTKSVVESFKIPSVSTPSIALIDFLGLVRPSER